jgi:hypothetical protein
MAERTARLVDHVLPDVSVRQRFLSLPNRIRYLLAWPRRSGDVYTNLSPLGSGGMGEVFGHRSGVRPEELTPPSLT